MTPEQHADIWRRMVRTYLVGVDLLAVEGRYLAEGKEPPRELEVARAKGRAYVREIAAEVDEIRAYERFKKYR